MTATIRATAPKPPRQAAWSSFHAPPALRAEHADLHRVLARAARETGEIGAVARGMVGVMHRHFLTEEQEVMPSLSLLAQLVRGRVPREAAEALTQADRLQAQVPELIEEHRHLETELGRLVMAAQREGKPEYADFARRLRLHVQVEEEVLYPAALLIAEYLKAIRFA